MWASENDVMSPVALFETSKMDESWTAHWITPDNPKPHPENAAKDEIIGRLYNPSDKNSVASFKCFTESIIFPYRRLEKIY